MIYAVAQIESERDNIPNNIKKHVEYINWAAKYGAQIIVFPEMSLTAYEHEMAKTQYFVIGDIRFNIFQELSTEKNIITIVGVPLMITNILYISSIIFIPKKRKELYIKKYLHAGEENIFQSSFDFDPDIIVNNEKLSFAICYDIEKDEHIQAVQKKHSTTYIASIFYSTDGIESGLARLQNIAKQYEIDIVMSNYIGKCWGIEAGGKSSIWSNKGNLIIQSKLKSESLLIAEKNGDKWIGKEIKA